MNVNDDFFAVDGHDYLAVFENGQTLEFQFIDDFTIDHVASYLFCRILFAVVRQDGVGYFCRFRSIFVDKDNVCVFDIVDALILNFSRC